MYACPARPRPSRPALRSILGEDDDAVRADIYSSIEVEAVPRPGIGKGVEAVAVDECRIVHRRAAVEPHDPVAAARKADVQGVNVPVGQVDYHDDIIARTAMAEAV